MALRNNNIAISIDATAKNAIKEFGKLKSSLTGVKGASAAGALALGAMALAMGAATKRAMTHAAQLELIQNKTAVVFGNQLPMIQEWSKETASAFGLTAINLEGMAAGFADLLVPMEFTREEAADMTKKVVGLAGAFSEWSAGTRTVEDTTRILARAMLGEREMLKDLGVDIRELDIKQRLMAKGQEQLTGNMLKQARATATMEMIFERSKDAQAGFATGGDNLVRTTRQVEAQIKELVQEVVLAMLPAFKDLMVIVRDDIMPVFQDFIPLIKAIAVAFAETVKIVTSIIGVFAAATSEVIGYLQSEGDELLKLEDAYKMNNEELDALVAQYESYGGAIDAAFIAKLKEINSHNTDARNKQELIRLTKAATEWQEKHATVLDKMPWHKAEDGARILSNSYRSMTNQALAAKLAQDLLNRSIDDMPLDQMNAEIRASAAILKQFADSTGDLESMTLLLADLANVQLKVAKEIAAEEEEQAAFNPGTQGSNTFTQNDVLRGFGATDPKSLNFGQMFAQELSKSTNIAAQQGSGTDSMVGAGKHFEGLATYLQAQLTGTIFTPETFTGIGQTILDQFGGIRAVTGAEVQKSANNNFYIQTGVGDPVAIGNEILRLIKMNPQYQADTLGIL